MNLTITSKPLAAPVGYRGKKGKIAFSVSGATTEQELSATATSSVNWIIPDRVTYNGKGKGAFSFTVTPSGSVHSRTGAITIAGKSYTIAQAGKPGSLTLRSGTSSIPGDGGSVNVDVSVDPMDVSWSITGVEYKPEAAVAWLHGLSVGETHTGSLSITIDADANVVKAARSAVVTIESSDGKITKKLTIRQVPSVGGALVEATKFAAKEKKFYVNREGIEKEIFLKGVNIGAAKPGYFPGEFGITKADYLRWFQQIYDMGANTIRVYTTLKPDFYDALYEFNLGKIKPLYFMQGVWVNEEDIATYRDAFAGGRKILNDFVQDAKKQADVVHGKITLPPLAGHASGSYTKDVSSYLIGWILGIEWDPGFVDTTNKNNPGMTDYDGVNIATEGAAPFEIFLAEVADQLVSYELQKYGAERPLSFTNWATTDTLTHNNEPFFSEDYVSVDTERIKTKPGFRAGLFASYHIYPYYPDMFSFQAEYINYVDETGRRNPYRAYLNDLIAQHTVPVVIAEFGIPSSRGKAHENAVTGFNQGFTDETTQGEQIVSMLNDIRNAGYAGGLIFSWQDEWFKRNWNTMDFDDPEMRPYWSNAQVCEQHFGLLSFDPGEEPMVTLDGAGTEWAANTLVSRQGTRELYMQSDEEYVYFMVRDTQKGLEGERIVIPVDVTSNSGSTVFESYGVETPADFVIVIDGSDSRIMVHSYYDSYYFLYGHRLGRIEKHPEYSTKNSTYFNRMMLALSKQLYLPAEQRTIPFTAYETGLLTNGIGDPDSPLFNSLSDWYVNGSTLEIRIPWQLLNFMSPSTGRIMDDFYERGTYRPIEITSIGAGVNSGSAPEVIDMGNFNLKRWGMPTYRERLKRSYFIVKERFTSME